MRLFIEQMGDTELLCDIIDNDIQVLFFLALIAGSECNVVPNSWGEELIIRVLKNKTNVVPDEYPGLFILPNFFSRNDNPATRWF